MSNNDASPRVLKSLLSPKFWKLCVLLTIFVICRNANTALFETDICGSVGDGQNSGLV